MVKLSTIKVIFVVGLLVFFTFYFMYKSIGDYYWRPITISSSVSAQNKRESVDGELNDASSEEAYEEESYAEKMN